MERVELWKPPHCGVVLRGLSREIDDLRPGSFCCGQVGTRELRRAGEENFAGAVKGAFFHRLNDGGFATHFGQQARGGFFVDQAKFGASETALFEQGAEFHPE